MSSPSPAPTPLGEPGNVFYFVADLAVAEAWYSARLGIEPVTRAAQLVMFGLPGCTLTLHQADEFNQPGPAGTVTYWPGTTSTRWWRSGASTGPARTADRRRS